MTELYLSGVPAQVLSHSDTTRQVGCSRSSSLIFIYVCQLLEGAAVADDALMVLGGSLGLVRGRVGHQQATKSYHLPLADADVQVLTKAVTCALDKSCIAPEGSSVDNHCFDQ